MPTGYFTMAELANELRQGEIISGLAQYFYDPKNSEVERIVHPFSVILSQDCDLLRDFESRKAEGASMSPLERFPLDVNRKCYRGFPWARKSEFSPSDHNGGGGDGEGILKRPAGAGRLDGRGG